MTLRFTSIITKSIFAFMFCFGIQQTDAQTIYALNKSNQLLSFSAASPTAITKMTTITGLLPGQNLVGMDTRPRTGELYVFGYNPLLSMGRLYKLNANSGVLTALGTADISVSLGASSDNIAMDFNPTVDRIRVLSTNRKNYRLHPDLGTVVATDTDLSYGTGDANASVTPQIGQIAYTNSYVSATKTTLYYLDEVNSVFGTAFVATNPNNGQIKTIGNTGLILNATDKTIVVTVHLHKVHPIYKKKYSFSRKFMAHDEKNQAKFGDKVSIEETRPLSARKRFALKEIIERPAIVGSKEAGESA